MKINHWIMAFRPKTLTAALVPVLVGGALAAAEGGPVQYWILALTILAALSIQIATNLFNDAIDFKKGADHSGRLGPQRVTQSGILSDRHVLAAGLGFSVLALLAGLPLVLVGGGPIVAIGVISLFLAYAYTGGPYPLAYRGLGDIFVLLFFGLIAVGGTYFLLKHGLNLSAMVAGFQIGCLATVLIAINNFRDAEQDQLVSKNTLAVRLGPRGTRLEITMLLLLPFFFNAYWYTKGYLWAFFLPLPVFFLVWKVIEGVWREKPSPIYNRFLGQSAAVHLLFGLLLALGLLSGPV